MLLVDPKLIEELDGLIDIGRAFPSPSLNWTHDVRAALSKVLINPG
jgi:hypothetical protein